jgi:predicted ester cyclase
MLIFLTAHALAQKTTASAPSIQQEVVLSYFRDVLDGAKVEALDSLVLPDCAIHRPEGELKGVAALRNMVAARRANFSIFTTQVDDIFESGDRVVVRLKHQGTGKGTYRFRTGLQEINGKMLTWQAIVIFRMQNAKIAEEWVSRDELGMLLSAGILKGSEPGR